MLFIIFNVNMETIEKTVPVSTYLDLEIKYNKVLHELQWLKRQLFGTKSERHIPNDQQIELDLGIEKSSVEIKNEEISYTRTKVKKISGHGREEMPTHLPYVDTIIEPQEDISNCEKLNDEISWEYEYKPGFLFVHRYIRPKFKENETGKILIGKLPERPVEKGNFGPGIMSTVTTDKYLYHMPLNRQIQKFRNEFQTEFAESTFCDLIKHTVFWLEPMYELKKKKLLQASYLQVDETPIPVLVKSKKGKTHKGFYWVYYDPVGKIVIFEYKTGRSREGPNNFLKDYSGILQVDGYSGYDELASRENIKRAACMAHVRRKFESALEYDKSSAEYALGIIGSWFEKERDAKKISLTYDQRLAMRNESMKSEFASFKEWMLKNITDHLPRSPIRKAMEYALGQWSGFDAFFEDGRVELSNNLVENAIRPVALGRKNYMFKGSEAAAQRGAIIYSIIATSKLHGKEPRECIKILLEELPKEKSDNLESYLPWKIDLSTKQKV